MPLEPQHKPQKKKKIITHFPNGMPIPKEMQRWVDKGVRLVESDHIHNCLIDASTKIDEAEGPTETNGVYDLYYISQSCFIINNDTNQIWLTKDSDPTDLTPEYWNNLIK